MYHNAFISSFQCSAMLLRCQIRFMCCQFFTLFFSFFLFSPCFLFYDVFQSSRPYSILPIPPLYNEEAVSRKLFSLSASACRVANTALYKFATWFLIQLVRFVIGFLFWIWLVRGKIKAFIYLQNKTFDLRWCS